jgi:hypothetical protein
VYFITARISERIFAKSWKEIGIMGDFGENAFV